MTSQEQTHTLQPCLAAPFDALGANDLEKLGGKGRHLVELMRAGFPVPAGFVVRVEAYREFLREHGLEQRIAMRLSAIEPNDSAALERIAADIRSEITRLPVPAHIAEEIRTRYRQLGARVAVRSSATAEDLPEASFAGQQSSYLNVAGADNVVTAVRACWASLFEARAIFYRAEKGYDHLAVGMAVVVQQMVTAERSGVVFTVEPLTSDRGKIVIEAVWGLGEALVSGAVTPDRYTVEKRSLRILERVTSEQQRQLVLAPHPRHALEANHWSEVPTQHRRRAKLRDQEIIALAKMAALVEEHYGGPQDIEWADQDGECYLVQARPVTTLPRRSSPPPSDETPESAAVLLAGTAASPGAGVGAVRLLRSAQQMERLRSGEVLVAEMTTPDFVPAMKRACAIVTDRGGRTCHAAIVARELGVPCVVGTGEATRVLRAGQLVTVDGDGGRVFDGRAERTLARAAWVRQDRRAAARLRTRTKILVNLADPDLAPAIAERNVDGVGLLRAEFMIARIGEHPRHALEMGRGAEFVAALAAGVEAFARAFAPRPVVYRTADFKTNEYRKLVGGRRFEPHEENPMLGFRGAARYIRDQRVFRMEIDALRQVHERHSNLCVMIPFVRTPRELKQVTELMAAYGLPRSKRLKLWMMAEVPANVLVLDRFIDVGIDGISIGSNDLTQLLLGIDRDSELLCDDFDERDEAVLRALKRLVRGGVRRGIEVSICGQAPSDYPELAERLVRWGITSMSVTPDAIEKTRLIVAKAEKAQERRVA